ncbi:MAG TPA: serpin family protein [Pirellulales bacterium]|nr:serpin family protein [Pirellulales bacterium]
MVAFGIGLAVCVCAVAGPESVLAREVAGGDSVPAVVAGNNGFAVALYGQLAKQNPQGNLFFSPHSVYGALLMAADGARGETLTQMADVLHFPEPVRSGANRESTTRQVEAGLAALNKRLMAANNVPDSLRRKVADLEAKLATANKEVSRLGRGSDFDAIEKAGQNARRIADELNKLLPQVDQYELRVANALWGEKTYPFHPTYLATICKNHGENSIFAVDFIKQAEVARQQINGWVAAQTNNRVRDIVPPGGVSPDMRLVLTNAVYFKGAWSQPFDADATADGKFTLSGGDTVDAPLMHRSDLNGGQYGAFNDDGSFFDTPTMVPSGSAEAVESQSPLRYPGDGGFTVLSLPYKGGALSMVFLVPRSAGGLSRIESQLVGGALPGWLARLAGRNVHVFLPKFRLETEYPLQGHLAALGMTRAFVPNLAGDGAQFDGMCESADPTHRLFISEVLHKAFVETGEKGTEAAAATVVLFPAAEAAAIQEMVPFTPTFRADKPFIFLIRDQQSGAILFLGRITNPKSG